MKKPQSFKVETLEEYLARGGKITKYGHEGAYGKQKFGVPITPWQLNRKPKSFLETQSAIIKRAIAKKSEET